MKEITITNIDAAAVNDGRLYKAVLDVLLGLGSWRIWLLLGWQDIRLRYRRSNLGPFWITLSMALTVYTLGILYSHLWRTTYHEYMLYFACGMLTWALISSIVNESANIFMEAKSYLLQIQIPLSVFVMRLLVRNVIVFLHNILAVVPLLIYFHADLNWHTLLVIPCLLLLLLPAFVFGFFLAIVGLRYRDIGQLITSLMNLAFFVTPIMWMPTSLSAHYQFFIKLNPFAQLVELIRAPLMGQVPSEWAFFTVLLLLLAGSGALLWCLKNYRHRIVFWL